MILEIKYEDGELNGDYEVDNRHVIEVLINEYCEKDDPISSEIEIRLREIRFLIIKKENQ